MRHSSTCTLLALLSLLATRTVLAQEPAKIELDRLIYITQDLDSLTRNFQWRGFCTEQGERIGAELQVNRIFFPNGDLVALQAPFGNDTGDWRWRMTEELGTFVGAVVFRTSEIEALQSRLVRAGVYCSAIRQATVGGRQRVFSIQTAGPLEIVFSEATSDRATRRDTSCRHTHEASGIQWLLLSASADQASELSKLFDALELPRRFEGWFDYWLLGPPEHRLAIRFEPPPARANGGSWLGLEDPGIIYMYRQ